MDAKMYRLTVLFMKVRESIFAATVSALILGLVVNTAKAVPLFQQVGTRW